MKKEINTYTLQWITFRICVICIILFFVFYIVQLIAMWHFPAEYRDGAMFQLTEDLARGVNPYSLNRIESSIPSNVVDSGFFHLFPAVILRKIGISSSASIYLSNLFYLLIITILTIRICFNLLHPNNLKDISFLAITALTTYGICFFMQRQTLLVTRPDIFCSMLLLAIIALWTETVIKTQFIYLASLFCALILFSKIHYAVIIISILLYIPLRFEKGKRAIAFVKFLLSGVIFSGLIFVLQQICYPIYSSIWIPRLLEMFFGNLEVTESTLSFLLRKIIRYSIAMSPFLIIIFVWLIKSGLKTKITKIYPITIQFLIINSFVNFFALLYVGRHPGADLWYFFIMLSPSLILIAGYCLYHSCKKSLISFSLSVISITWCGATIFYLYRDTRREIVLSHTYQQAYKEIDSYASESMYLSPFLSNYSIEKNIYNYQNGDAFYVANETFIDHLYSIIPFIHNVLPYSKEIYNQHYLYQEYIIEQIRKKKYSLIVLDNIGNTPPFHTQLFNQYLNENYISAITFTDFVYYIPKK